MVKDSLGRQHCEQQSTGVGKDPRRGGRRTEYSPEEFGLCLGRCCPGRVLAARWNPRVSHEWVLGCGCTRASRGCSCEQLWGGRRKDRACGLDLPTHPVLVRRPGPQSRWQGLESGILELSLQGVRGGCVCICECMCVHACAHVGVSASVYACAQVHLGVHACVYTGELLG